MVPTAAMAKVAKEPLPGTTTLEPPGVLTAKTSGAAIAAWKVLTCTLVLVDLAEMFTRTVRLAALLRPTASMAPVQSSQREEWCQAEDLAEDMLQRSGDLRRTKWRPWSSRVALRGELAGGCF